MANIPKLLKKRIEKRDFEMSLLPVEPVAFPIMQEE